MMQIPEGSIIKYAKGEGCNGKRKKGSDFSGRMGRT